MRYILFCLSAYMFFILGETAKKVPIPYNETKQDAKYDNPNFIRDRFKNTINKPVMPGSWKARYKQKYSPYWMDYCDPWHCNDYHKPACGLNRKTMKFRWFQSNCHIILHNSCAKFRGAIKFTAIQPKWCGVYVRDLRSGCPKACDETLQPVCAVSYVDGHVVVFKNTCYMEQANCRIATFDEYEEAPSTVCVSAFTQNKL